MPAAMDSPPPGTPLGATIYQAAPGYEAELRAELGAAARPLAPESDLFTREGPPVPAAWAANVWLSPVRIVFASTGDAARALSALGRNWAQHPVALHRRANLIADRVPFLSGKPLPFPAPKPPPLGSWALVDATTLVASARCTSPFPNGEARFVEDHENPPSRAYLKLWEALTVAGRLPGPGTRCVDLGASPGGWTWALERLGARVLSVDKAPLDRKVASLSRVKCIKESAFALDPAAAGKVEWITADIICYPERIVALVERWIAVHTSASFVVTVKFQGATDMAPLQALTRVPGSRLTHLSHNKHELTWIRLGAAPAAAKARTPGG
jgi:23S rRNA (cytidine2498-2'-O)-methyltransferase